MRDRRVQKRAYRVSPEGQAVQRAYNQSPEGRASAKRYRESPRGCYVQQRKRARQRGIVFSLTFEEFLAIWGDMFAHRGKGSDQFCMSRIGDSGPYAVGNVRIVTTATNLREARAHE